LPNDARRASLTQQRRAERLATARRKLAAFLDTLDPLLRRYLVAPESLTVDEMLKVGVQKTSSKQEQERQAAVLQYEHLLIQVPDLWRRHCKRQAPWYKLLAEWRLRSQIPRRGAPKKAPQDSEAVLVAEKVRDAEQRLKKGCELRRQLKRAGGLASDDTEIQPKLQALSYVADECLAILRTKSPLGAAVFLVARQLRREQSSIRSSLNRVPKNAKRSIGPRFK
jgi:hypothetical protein